MEILGLLLLQFFTLTSILMVVSDVMIKFTEIEPQKKETINMRGA
jgi:hypothetical protein